MNFTDNALKEIKKLINENETPTSGIRFYTTQGCCSPTLQMDFVNNPSQGDSVLQIEDVTVFITSEAEKILAEIMIDYYDNSFHSVKTSSDESKGKCC
jgi:iron-sulfur cluster assembly accessory protein